MLPADERKLDTINLGRLMDQEEAVKFNYYIDAEINRLLDAHNAK